MIKSELVAVILNRQLDTLPHKYYCVLLVLCITHSFLCESLALFMYYSGWSVVITFKRFYLAQMLSLLIL